MIQPIIKLENADQMVRPLLFYLIFIGGICYEAYKNKKINTLPFLWCVLLCIILLINIFLETVFINSIYLLGEALSLTGGALILTRGIIEVVLIIDIMAYFQCNVLKIFGATWTIKKKRNMQIFIEFISIILFFIYALAYWKIYDLCFL